MAIKNLNLQKDYGKTEKPVLKQPVQPEHLQTSTPAEENFMSDYLNESINEKNNISSMAEPKTKEKEIIERIEAFFKTRCGSDEFVKQLREYRYETINLAFSEDESKYDKPAVIEGAYWIHEFCETIAPYFKTQSELKRELDL